MSIAGTWPLTVIDRRCVETAGRLISPRYFTIEWASSDKAKPTCEALLANIQEVASPGVHSLNARGFFGIRGSLSGMLPHCAPQLGMTVRDAPESSASREYPTREGCQ